MDRRRYVVLTTCAEKMIYVSVRVYFLTGRASVLIDGITILQSQIKDNGVDKITRGQ